MMTGEPREGDFEKIGQAVLQQQAVELLGVAPEEIEAWHINYISVEGRIVAEVPLDQISVEGVPTNPPTVEEVKGLLDEYEAEFPGTTGQRDPGVACHVKGEALYLVDGFHRHKAQTERGKDILILNIEPDCTYEKVVKLRLEYARKHEEIEFARQVDWMQSDWARTEWSRKLPNVLTAFRAIRDDYYHQGTDDVPQIEQLTDKEYAAVCAWVEDRSEKWGYSPASIREKLAKVENFAPSLMHLVYQKKGPAPDGRISMGHVDAIGGAFPLEFDLQEEIVNFVTKHRLSGPRTELLIARIDDHDVVSAEQLKAVLDDIDVDDLQEVARARSNGRGGSRGRGTSLGNASSLDLLLALEHRLVDSDEETEWTTAEARAAAVLVTELAHTVLEMVQKGDIHLDLGAIALKFGEMAGVEVDIPSPAPKEAPKRPPRGRSSRPIIEEEPTDEFGGESFDFGLDEPEDLEEPPEIDLEEDFVDDIEDDEENIVIEQPVAKRPTTKKANVKKDTANKDAAPPVPKLTPEQIEAANKAKDASYIAYLRKQGSVRVPRIALPDDIKRGRQIAKQSGWNSARLEMFLDALDAAEERIEDYKKRVRR